MPSFAQDAVVPQYRNSGWAVSFATHSVGAGIAVILLNSIHPPTIPEPFRWDVSVTEKQAPVAVAEPPHPVPPPSTPMKNTPQRSDSNEMPMERRVVESHPRSRSVQSQPSILTKASEVTERRVQAQGIPQETVHFQTPLVRELETVNKTAETQSVAAINTPIEEAILDNSPPIIKQNEVAESANPVATQQMIQESPDSSVVERNVVTDSTAKTDSVETASPIETTAVQTKPVVKSGMAELASKHEPIQSDAMAGPISPLVTQPSTNESASAESSQQASVKHVPQQSMPATKADYGWLREALWNRIERLKGYPYIARTNRWEGLVILEAVINDEGQLVDLKIAESSGHSVLDQDAMEVMRKSCPLRLKHSLGKSAVTMRVPISYKLR
jgi:protein TonB